MSSYPELVSGGRECYIQLIYVYDVVGMLMYTLRLQKTSIYGPRWSSI